MANLGNGEVSPVRGALASARKPAIVPSASRSPVLPLPLCRKLRLAHAARRAEAIETWRAIAALTKRARELVDMVR
jgi:hypothetical protein